MEKENFDKLDYTIQDLTQRVALVNTIVQQYEQANIEINSQYLTVMADYCLGLDIKKQYKDRSILTKNRMITIYKRESSYDSLVADLPNGDNDIYNMMVDEPGLYYLTNQNKITLDDVEEIPDLKNIQEEIKRLQALVPQATGKHLYALKKIIITLQQNQYIIKTLQKDNNLGLIQSTRAPKSTHYFCVEGEIIMDENGNITDTSNISLTNPLHVKEILHRYSDLKQFYYDKYDADIRYVIEDLEDIIDGFLKKEKPAWWLIMVMKIDGSANEAIAEALKDELGVDLTENSISTIWCQSLPKLIAKEAIKKYVKWYYNYYHLPMKVCSKCHKKLPASKYFYHTNNKSADRLYSICKQCRKAV